MRFKRTLKRFSSQNSQGQVTTNAYIGRNANVRLTNYLDNAPPMTQPYKEPTDLFENHQEEDEEFRNIFGDSPDNHSDDSSASTDTVTHHGDENPTNPTKAPSKNYRDDIPPNLRRPFRDPRLSKVNPYASLLKTPPTNSHKASSTEITPNTSNKINHDSSLKEINRIDTEAIPNHNRAAITRDLFNLKFKPLKIYTSPYLEDEYKPQANSIKLNPELEHLHPLIMSQHEVFAQHIIDLSNTSLTLTKTIEKKRNSYNQLKENKKVPKSLRIKVELTTSPSYVSNQNFLKLKEKLQLEVSNFIEKSTEIMTDWALIYLKLLINERCSAILSNAIQILNGLSSFYAEIIGTPEWPSTSKKHITLFLLKLYLSNSYLEIKDLEEFLETPLNELLQAGTKLFLNTESNEEVNDTLSNLNLSDFDPTNELQATFVSETLTNFDQILKISLIDIWRFNKERLKQASAAQNLKFTMKTLKTNEATKATASAITKAVENVAKTNTTNLQNALRLSNLERTVRKNEQKSNEFFKKTLNSRRNQKNSLGSHTQEHMASPHQQAPNNKNLKRKQKLVDLTLEDDSEENSDHGTSKHNHYTRNPIIRKKTRNFSPPHQKTVQWSGTKIKSFNPNQPVSSNFNTHFAHSSLPLFGQPWNPLNLSTAPPPGPPIQQHSHIANYQYPAAQQTATRIDFPQMQYQQQGLNQNPFLLQNQTRYNTTTKNNPFRN